MTRQKRRKRITDTPCYINRRSPVPRWSPDDGPPPAVWVVRTSDSRYIGPRRRPVTDPAAAQSWEIRAAADVVAAAVGGEVVDLHEVAPPPYPPPAGPEHPAARLRRLYRNIAARNRRRLEAGMPPAPRVMSREVAEVVIGASGLAGWLRRVAVAVVGCRKSRRYQAGH